MVRITRECGGFYQRYSDDILIICTAGSEKMLRLRFEELIAAHKLKINRDKMERAEIGSGKIGRFQYLGFDIDEQGATIRHSSLSNQWRRAKRNLKRARHIGQKAILAGHAKKIFTSTLRKRFQPIGIRRSFSSYARRSAKAFGSKRILNQVRRFERVMRAAIDELNPRVSPSSAVAGLTLGTSS